MTSSETSSDAKPSSNSEEPRVSAEQLERTLDGVSEFLMVVSARGRVLAANRTVRKAVDREASDWVSCYIWDVDKVLEPTSWVRLVADLGRGRDLEFTGGLLTREGISIPLDYRARWIEGADGVVALFGRAVSADDLSSGGIRFNQLMREEASKLASVNARLQAEIAGHMETEQQLRDSRERLELALWASELGLWDWRTRRDRMILDRSAAQLLGLDTDEGVSIDAWRTRIHEADLPEFDASLQRHFEGGSDLFECIHRVRQEDGEYRWLQARGRASDREEDDSARRIIGTLQDISSRRALEAELLQSQKLEAIGRLAGGVAHDFNNLLTAINGYSDLVLRTLDPQSSHYKHIEEVRRAGQRAASLTNRLLSFGRKQVIQPQPLDLSGLLSRLKPLLLPAVGDNIELMLDLNEVPSVRADAHQVEQAVLNLVVNARDAISSEGSVRIETAGVVAVPPRDAGRPRPFVRLSVVDNGSGISEEVRSRMFEPFFTTKAQGDGSGLGLSMVYGMVQEAGGFLDVESTLGEGTRVSLFLPVTESSDLTASEAFRVVLGREVPEASNVLLVEDEPAVCRLLEQALTEEGYTVKAVRSGELALDALGEMAESPDLLVTDVVLGGINGVEVARMLRKTLPKLPVLFVSGYAESAIDGRLPVDGRVGFLRKPFRVEDFLGALNGLLEGRIERAR